MKDELVRKIQEVLNRRITNETKVVYLLVELRKLMDRENYVDSALRTFSNWVVHTSLENRSDGSTWILGQFDDLMTEIYEHHKNLPHVEHLSLRTFRGALIRFFEHFGLSASFVTNKKEWKKFCELYCLIVSECPIVFTASKKRLKYIRKVELTGIASGIFVKEWPVVHWQITFHDGSTHDWGFQMT